MTVTVNVIIIVAVVIMVRSQHYHHHPLHPRHHGQAKVHKVDCVGEKDVVQTSEKNEPVVPKKTSVTWSDVVKRGKPARESPKASSLKWIKEQQTSKHSNNESLETTHSFKTNPNVLV